MGLIFVRWRPFFGDGDRDGDCDALECLWWHASVNMVKTRQKCHDNDDDDDDDNDDNDGDNGELHHRHKDFMNFRMNQINKDQKMMDWIKD